MMPYLTEAYGNPSSQHPKGQEAARALIMAREQAARALSVHPSEITFTGGGSESDNQALITGAHIAPKKESVILFPPSWSIMPCSTV